MVSYNVVAENNESTIVAEYIPEQRVMEDSDYQSEAALERKFINQLTSLGYEYLTIHDEKALITNLRTQLERLNKYTFSDNEWKTFFDNCIANSNEGIVEKTRRFQTDHIQVLKQDDGSSRNILLIDKKQIHNNKLQVINQYEENTGNYKNRYDVTILVNGFPCVHIELKRRGVAIREAFNQINRYQRDSFWASCGLFEYVQIFVISNGTHTKYYSNTTRDSHVKEFSASGKRQSKKTSNSFEFTSYWADGKNKIIPDLVDFTKTFFVKHCILNVLTKYSIFTSQDMLLVMRPYQIAATERILNRIEISTNYKKTGTLEAGGYIWHTTGSGKTLTSFKTAQLASTMNGIDKVLFVVDRKDLDYQTIREYDRFEKGAANGNSNTRILQKQLENPDCHIIVTTIQKLSVFIKKNSAHDVYKKHVVLIFDECHRSQFGEMHSKIVKYFKNYHLFGFTGTPIFAANAGATTGETTTSQIFGDKLHTYTIVDAIGDGNVLPFKIDYVNTMKSKKDLENDESQVYSIDKENALMAPDRISKIVEYILKGFDTKTVRSRFYNHNGKRLNGFNSIFAVASIPFAKMYYLEFKKQLEAAKRDLTVATIFSFSPNENQEDNGILSDEEMNTDDLDKSSRDFLEMAIRDYNKKFNTNFDTSSEKFENYYKDLSQRVKNREVDLLIVVNMFLTGFDATTLNTLWVDKNLRYHGLIQAFSRTNRILNSVKTFGNIICFRNLRKATDDAIALFGDREAQSLVLLKDYESYYYGYEDKNKAHVPGYKELIEKLQHDFPIGEPIQSEEAKEEFIKQYSAILRAKNVLNSFDSFEGNEILTERDFQDYQSVYIDLYDEYKEKKNTSAGCLVNKNDPNQPVTNVDVQNDLVFEIELIEQLEVNIDYILSLVEIYHKSNCENKEILTSITKAISSSPHLRKKKDLIESFVATINSKSKVNEDWIAFVQKKKEEELNKIIADEKLKIEETKKFMDNSLRDGVLKEGGTDIDKLMPKVSLFAKGANNRSAKKKTVLQKLKEFFEKFLGLA